MSRERVNMRLFEILSASTENITYEITDNNMWTAVGDLNCKQREELFGVYLNQSLHYRVQW